MWWNRSSFCGLFTAFLTLGLTLFAQFVIVNIVLLPWFGISWHSVLYTFGTVLSVISHCKAQFMNPGVVPKGYRPQSLETDIRKHAEMNPPLYCKMCKKCEQPKPRNAHHCSSCNHCIIRMDHHWSGSFSLCSIN